MTNGRNMLKSLQKCPWEDKWIFSRIINLINKFACIFIRAIEVFPAQLDERCCVITSSFTFCHPLPFVWITEKRRCVYTCVCVYVLVCACHLEAWWIDLTHYVVGRTPLHLMCTLIQRTDSFMHIFIHTYLTCVLHYSHIPLHVSSPYCFPNLLLSGGQFLAPILSRKPSWVARLCVVKNVRPSVKSPHLCRAIFKVSKVWRRRLAAWHSCPRIPTPCQPWTGTITWAHLSNTLAIHVPFSCIICASQRQRNSLGNFIWRCFVILSGYS